MARGAPSPAPALPKVLFKKVEDAAFTEPAGVHDQQARSYGYNGFSNFRRPEHYIRYIEPLESELAVQVEYDMDEQDQQWLDAVNSERKAEQSNRIPYETFEIIMDRLEKEWFDLTKNIPKPDMALPSEDSTCAICDDAEGENSNAIVFCDGCNLAVHQDCYGVPYIPEGQWLCRKCTVSPENPVSCMLCPNEGGAFKQTVLGEWVHLLCAIWVPETRVANDVYMEPITGVEKINKQRWKLKCSLCDVREGACIQCSKNSCFLAFHTTCARREKLLMPMKSAQGTEPAVLAAFCEKHLPKEQLAAHEAALAEQDSDAAPAQSASSNMPPVTPRSSKKARAYAKTYKLGPPLVPAIIVRRILQYISRIKITRRPDFVHLVCRYWSLKREARRGAPLLKRLHLEPWTASTAGKSQTEEEMALKLEHLKLLRKDLEKVRILADLVRKREVQKLKQAQIIQDLLSTCIYPHEPHFRLAFERIVSLDRHDYFKYPVSRADVPDYFEVIKNPLCWNDIEAKLDGHEYWDVSEFQNDINLVLSNALSYNKSGHPLYKAAHRIKASARAHLQELDQLKRHPPGAFPAPDSDAEPPETHSPRLVGELEPPLSVLELLSSLEAIKDDSELILDADPLSYLFSYKFGELKPPPPPPPPKQRRPRKERKSFPSDTLDGAPGFRARAPRTRSARAAAAAFEAEAGAEDVSMEVEDVTDDALGNANAAADNASENVDADGPTELSEMPEGETLAAKESGRMSAAGRGRRTRRALATSTQDMPPVVHDVSGRQSFALFDEGWILPTGQKRGGRALVERSEPAAPPKKRMRARSRLSVFSTAVSENQTLRKLTPGHDTGEAGAVSSAAGPPSPQPGAMDVMEPDAGVKFERGSTADAQAGLVGPAPASTSETEGDLTAAHVLEEVPAPLLSPTRIVEKDGVIIIEELDTPATRRAKASAQKRLRQKRLEEAGAEREGVVMARGVRVAGHPGEGSVNAGPSNAESGALAADAEESAEGMDVSDLSSLSNESEDEREARVPRRASGEARAARVEAQGQHYAPGSTPDKIILRDGHVLESGTMVWAKADTYPWWPAVVYDTTHEDVPPGVLKSIRPGKKSVGVLHLVRFFDKKKSWQLLPLNRLKLFSEDKALDDTMLEGGSKLQHFKNPRIKDECLQAFNDAMAEKETDADVKKQGGGREEDDGAGGASATLGQSPTAPAKEDADLVAPGARIADSDSGHTLDMKTENVS